MSIQEVLSSKQSVLKRLVLSMKKEKNNKNNINNYNNFLSRNNIPNNDNTSTLVSSFSPPSGGIW